MPSHGFLLPWVTTACAGVDVLRAVEKCRRKLAIGSAVKVDHIIDIPSGIAMQVETRARWAIPLALLRIPREPVSIGGETDRPIVSITKPNADSAKRLAMGGRTYRPRFVL
jgi:hypothetical protein